jgi:glycosyltransferase involved in cell wall biosynthesis
MPKLISYKSPPLVAILMCTFNGEKYLKEQIESIKNQTFKNWILYISDDGSSDKTIEIIYSFKKKLGKKLVLLKGPQKGYVENFLFITRNVNSNFYFWSDQDDVWHPKKVQEAVFWLQEQPEPKAALYCGRSILVDSNNQFISLSPLFQKPPSFNNAIIQNIGSGNTMAFNNMTKKLLLSISDVSNIVTHDWTIYQITAAFKGNIFYEKFPYIEYRQHEQNAIGMKIGLRGAFRHLKLIINGSIKSWNRSNLKLLNQISGLPKESKNIVKLIIEAEKKSVWTKLKTYKLLSIYRQSFLGQLALYFSILIGKF